MLVNRKTEPNKYDPEQDVSLNYIMAFWTMPIMNVIDNYLKIGKEDEFRALCLRLIHLEEKEKSIVAQKMEALEEQKQIESPRCKIFFAMANEENPVFNTKTIYGEAEKLAREQKDAVSESIAIFAQCMTDFGGMRFAFDMSSVVEGYSLHGPDSRYGTPEADRKIYKNPERLGRLKKAASLGLACAAWEVYVLIWAYDRNREKYWNQAKQGGDPRANGLERNFCLLKGWVPELLYFFGKGCTDFINPGAMNDAKHIHQLKMMVQRNLIHHPGSAWGWLDKLVSFYEEILNGTRQNSNYPPASFAMMRENISQIPFIKRMMFENGCSAYSFFFCAVNLHEPSDIIYHAVFGLKAAFFSLLGEFHRYEDKLKNMLSRFAKENPDHFLDLIHTHNDIDIWVRGDFDTMFDADVLNMLIKKWNEKHEPWKNALTEIFFKTNANLSELTLHYLFWKTPLPRQTQGFASEASVKYPQPTGL